MVSDAVHSSCGPLCIERYVTDVTIFTARGDIFPERERHVSVILLSVFKYLTGQIFFLTRESRVISSYVMVTSRL